MAKSKFRIYSLQRVPRILTFGPSLGDSVRDRGVWRLQFETLVYATCHYHFGSIFGCMGRWPYPSLWKGLALKRPVTNRDILHPWFLSCAFVGLGNTVCNPLFSYGRPFG